MKTTTDINANGKIFHRVQNCASVRERRWYYFSSIFKASFEVKDQKIHALLNEMHVKVDFKLILKECSSIGAVIPNFHDIGGALHKLITGCVSQPMSINRNINVNHHAKYHSIL